MKISKIFEDVLNGGAEQGRTYIDSWDKKVYTSDEINGWIQRYQRTHRMPTKDRQAFKAFFKRLGLSPKDYEKVKPNSIIKLKKELSGYYVAEGVIDGYNIKARFEGPDSLNQWCFYWYVNDVEMWSDCLGGGLRSLTNDLDGQAKDYIEQYKREVEKGKKI